ncbi:exclusive to iev [Raccoonpox virus]|uniref:Protein OPG056 n=1 Tax=Raccoon poxvirus TaxID=10256 RepID=A0A0G3FZY6_RACVI|nr:Exclusive to IEV [Raccoonpox virus]AKJ93679.1 Exclusive to IEV [Raccoonpox virus]AOP31310.1 exclusive to iev [Raccoonpox virus]
MLRRIQTLLQTANDYETIEILRNYLRLYMILARNEEGRGIIIYNDNMDSVISMLDITKLEAIGLTHCTKLKSPPTAPMYRLFMDEIDHESHYSPKTSDYPLIDILKKRSHEQGDIALALERYGIDNTDSISEINEWLSSKGLACYRFVKFNEYRNQKHYKKFSRYTIVDSMVIGHIGHHYIWIKNLETYVRPEIDVLPFDVKCISNDELWSRIPPSFDQVNNIKTFTVSVYGAITDKGPIPYMISTYPGNTFVNFNSVKDLILDFLDWIKDVISNVRTIILVGYMSNLFDLPLLTAYWPNNCEWKIYNNTLISSDGDRVIWIDAYKFSCGLSLQDYCFHWGSKYDSRPFDLIKKSDAKRNIKSLVKESIASLKSLFEAFETQSVALEVLMSPCKMVSFPRIEDMFFTSVINRVTENTQLRMYYPTSYMSSLFIESSISLEYITVNNQESSKYHIKSILDIISSKKYPAGRPKYVKNGTKGKLYIALCKVTVPSDDSIPIIYHDDDNTTTFDTVLTSVDIETAIRGGYSIVELGAIQWDENLPEIKDCLLDSIKMIYELNAHTTNRLLEQLIENVNFTDFSIISLFYTFAISYCRAFIYSIIETMDNTYISQYNYKELYISNSYKDINEYISKKMIKL